MRRLLHRAKHGAKAIPKPLEIIREKTQSNDPKIAVWRYIPKSYIFGIGLWGWLHVKAKRVALYLRVSTNDQRVDNQRRELLQVSKRNDWTVVSTFVDEGISGAKGRKDRAGYDALLKSITRREVDLIAAWSVDRLGRSLTDLLGFLGEIHSKGCDLYLHQQGLDTSTPAGRAMFQMMGVFAEFERAIIRERVLAGLARAKAEGKQLGRPTISYEVEAEIKSLRAEGIGIQKIARALRVGVSTVQRVISK